ncbi:hypothetical protein HYN59_00810 [Flavobacterium album]|uniref:Lipocalin-like domain-containing protein n=1 Tax=Flavobacterium album TaxID=2175091 RepID=A0A2S1QTM9_9FLAO|nr:hypothetical protein [Flavobacterium album]AWH83743.1 hypothetical protein HYN59_00810 [Flavobacterium album]
MKKALLLLLLFPAFTFAQSLTGKWASKEDKARMVQFNADGTMMFIDPETPEDLEGVVIKYILTTEAGVKYMTCEIFMAGEKMDSQKNVYKLEGDTLTIIENAEDIEPGKSPDNVFYRMK